MPFWDIVFFFFLFELKFCQFDYDLNKNIIERGKNDSNINFEEPMLNADSEISGSSEEEEEEEQQQQQQRKLSDDDSIYS